MVNIWLIYDYYGYKIVINIYIDMINSDDL